MKRYQPLELQEKVLNIPKAEAYWINQYGDIMVVDITHIDKIIRNPEHFGLSMDEVKAVFAAEGENIGEEGIAREKIIVDLLKEGWIRIRYYRRLDRWSVNVRKMTDRARDYLKNWADTMIHHGVKYSEVLVDTPHQVKTFSISDIAADVLYQHFECVSRPGKKRFMLKFWY